MKFDLKANKEHKKISFYNNKSDLNSSSLLKNRNFFLIKKIKVCLIIILFFLIYNAASYVTGFKNISIIFKLPSGFIWLLKNFIPDSASLKYLPAILKSFGETCAIAVAASTTAGFLAFGLAVLGSETTGINKFFKLGLTLSASFFRNIPLVAWAMLLLFSFKQNNFTGFAALLIVTFGHLLRAFKEMIDETSSESFEALRAAGSSYISAVFQGVLPNAAPALVSWLLYTIENNVRDSALIGILTGTGIGFLFNFYFKSFRYNSAGLIILVLVIAVLLIDIVSNRIRKGLL